MSDCRPIWRCVWIVLLLIGCGQRGDRQRLEGTVTLDGAPLAEGQITFVPQPGTKGPTAGGQIAEGYFSIPNEGGTFTGTLHHVSELSTLLSHTCRRWRRHHSWQNGLLK